MTRRTNVKSESWDDESLPIRTTNDDTKKISAETKSGNILKRRKIEQSFPTIDEEENEPSGVEVILPKKCDKEKHFQKLREKRGHRSSINKPRSRKPPFSLLLQAGLILLVIHGYAATENVTVVLKIQKDTVVYGQTLVIECTIEEKCLVTSWSVGKTTDNFDTILRRNKTFDDSNKYGGNVVTKDNTTMYKLMIYRFDKMDEHSVYRCECGDLFKARTLTDINKKLRFVTDANPPKNDQDSPKTIDDWVIAVVVVVVVVLLLVFSIVGIAGVRWYLKQKMPTYQQANSSQATSSSGAESVDMELDDMQVHEK